MLKFGKSATALLAHKQSFFEDNDRLVMEGRRIAEIYRMQPPRTRCKYCDGPLGAPLFVKNGVGYTCCPRCGHLNGLHDDTAEFCEAVYAGNGATSYAKTYNTNDYEARVRDIYMPKVQFLHEALADFGGSKAFCYADLGAGSGYFVAALRTFGLDAVGYEVGIEQVKLAEAHLGRNTIRLHRLDETAEIAERVKASVVSMIGVLEHLPNPREVLQALCSNKHAQYLFLSVPLFSPSVFFEIAFPEVFQRHLAGGHTHLFTDRSLDWLCTEFKMERVAEWWFGADAIDLYRALTVMLHKSAEVKEVAAVWSEMFLPAIDGVQIALDRKRLASEVHLLLRLKEVGPLS